jgi:glycosyltransferase involved in cell wall biosynthesis
MNGFTAHIIVKNEERFINYAIESALLIADQVIVFDTGSTDSTIEIVQSLVRKYPNKIFFFEKGNQSTTGLVELRNEMIKLTKTDWFFLVDGDEVVSIKNLSAFLNFFSSLSEKVSRVEVNRRDFIGDANLVARNSLVGRFYKTNKIVFFGEYPFEYPVLKDFSKETIESFSVSISEDLVLYNHFTYFARSQKDNDVKFGRHWRKLPFPILLYFGSKPVPNIDENLVVALLKFPIYNLIGLFNNMLLFNRK